MFYVARIYKTLNPSIVNMCSNEQNAHDLARILSEETGCEHMVLQCVVSVRTGTIDPVPAEIEELANEITDVLA